VARVAFRRLLPQSLFRSDWIGTGLYLLFWRVFLTRTGIHFAWKRSRSSRGQNGASPWQRDRPGDEWLASWRLRALQDSFGSSFKGYDVVFGAWTLNVWRYPRIKTICQTGYGWRRSLIGFDRPWRRRGDEIGDAPCHCSGDQNGRYSKFDHFFSRSSSLLCIRRNRRRSDVGLSGSSVSCDGGEGSAIGTVASIKAKCHYDSGDFADDGALMRISWAGSTKLSVGQITSGFQKCVKPKNQKNQKYFASQFWKSEL